LKETYGTIVDSYLSHKNELNISFCMGKYKEEPDPLARKIAFFTWLSQSAPFTDRYYGIPFRLIQWDL
jgi:hypothetical protein